METVRTKYLGGLRTQAEHVPSGAKILTESPVDNHWTGDAFSPTDLFAASYSCCALTVIGYAAQTHGFNIDGAEVKTAKMMASSPSRIAELSIEFTFPHNNYSEKERKIIERSVKQCPVANSIDPAMKISSTIVYRQ